VGAGRPRGRLRRHPGGLARPQRAHRRCPPAGPLARRGGRPPRVERRGVRAPGFAPDAPAHVVRPRLARRVRGRSGDGHVLRPPDLRAADPPRSAARGRPAPRAAAPSLAPLHPADLGRGQPPGVRSTPPAQRRHRVHGVWPPHRHRPPTGAAARGPRAHPALLRRHPRAVPRRSRAPTRSA
jgi:hypothetical protein